MKKIICLLIMFCVGIICIGCNSVDVNSVMSEKTEFYYSGRGNCGMVEISIGGRENPYIMDGIHNETVGFSLISLMIDNPSEDCLNAVLIIDEKKVAVTLELNPLNMMYMGDLGFALRGEEKLIFCYQNENIYLEKTSDTFKVDCNRAVEIGYKQIDNLSAFKGGNKFLCEGYLKVINGVKLGNSGLFWCFSLIDQNGYSENVLINTMDENDVIKN